MNVSRWKKESGMRKTLVFFVIAIIGSGCAGGKEFEAPGLPEVKAPDADKQQAAESSNVFALDLYARLQKEPGNLFLSPFSISTALAMTYGGARGDTAAQMAQALHLDLQPEQLHPAFGALQYDLAGDRKDKAYKLFIANALWGQKGFTILQPFLDLTAKNYGAGLRTVDFQRETEAARKTINNWVEERTNRKIKDLIKQDVLNPATTLVLTNAIYFLGEWLEPFKAENTNAGQFAKAGGGKVNVQMMHQSKTFSYGEGDAYQLLRLPYKAGDLEMAIFLPKAEDGLDAFEQELTLRELDAALDAAKPERVRVSLPKFEMAAEFDLNDSLKKLGMNDAFVPGVADFTGIGGSKGDLFIAHVLHKAYVKVDEKGTEAAAATAVIMKGKAMPAEEKIFNADHPFFFVIRDGKTGVILFAGRLCDPAA